MKPETCVIMQPTYLPWCGYFDLIDQADVFIFLDDVQFSKQSWQQRNRIRTANGLEWLTVPVLTHGKSTQNINEVQIRQIEFYGKHLRAIEMVYQKSPFYHEIISILDQIYQQGSSFLADLNGSIIRAICSYMGLEANFTESSQFPSEKTQTERLVELCQKCQCEQYLTTPGSLDYLQETSHYFRDAGLDVIVHQYEHPVYQQRYQPFLPYASVLDLLFHHGPESLKIIRSGRKPSIPLVS